MFKKVLLTLCLSSFLAWAAQADDEFDDSDFMSASDAGAPHATAASDDGDDDFDEAEGGSSISNSQQKDLEARKKFEEEQRLPS